MKYLDHPAVQKAFNHSSEYSKSAKTGLRYPSKDQVGQPFDTFVKDGEGVRLEVSNTIGINHVIARNPEPISIIEGAPIFNEWLIEKPVAIKSYGDVVDNLSEENGFYQKTGSLRAVELTSGLLKELGATGDTLEITVDWSPNPMIAKVGDFLTDKGYSISANDMKTTYNLVPPVLSPLKGARQERQERQEAVTAEPPKPIFKV